MKITLEGSPEEIRDYMKKEPCCNKAQNNEVVTLLKCLHKILFVSLILKAAYPAHPLSRSLRESVLEEAEEWLNSLPEKQGLHLKG